MTTSHHEENTSYPDDHLDDGLSEAEHRMARVLENRTKSISKLFHMQDDNNQVQHSPHWLTFEQDKRPDYRMTYLELVEVWDHLPCGQWWKKGDQSETFLDLERREQAALEIVDAVHFALSHDLILLTDIVTDGDDSNDVDVAFIAHRLAEISLTAGAVQEEFLAENPTTEAGMIEFNNLIDTAIINSNHLVFNDSPYNRSRRSHIELHSSFELFWSSVFQALLLLDYSFDQAVALYVTKNRLNTFRVRNGYTKKEGKDRYVKVWYDLPSKPGVLAEDNSHIPHIAREAAARYNHHVSEGAQVEMEHLVDDMLVIFYTARLKSLLEQLETQGQTHPFMAPVNGWEPYLAPEGYVTFRHIDRPDTVMQYVGFHPGFYNPEKPDAK